MKRIVFLFIVVFNVGATVAFAQVNQPNKPVENQAQSQMLPPSANPIDNISTELVKISKSIQTFNKRIKDLLDQFGQIRGSQLNERQQKLLLGFEILNRAEQRLEILQKFQIELTEKESSVRTNLARVEQNSRQESIDRNVAFVGTTKTEELRENQRRVFESERASLTSLLSQIRGNLVQTTNELRQAETLVQNLRKKILPQIESEISDL